MQRWALIKDGVVDSVVEQDEQPQIEGDWVVLEDGYGPGDYYSGDVFIHPDPVDDPAKWLIDIGPFFDRFGAVKFSILTSANPLVRALVTDIQCRKWVDLQRPEVEQGLDMLISLGVSGMTPELKEAILTTEPTPDENLALRKLYLGLGA
jgi:hypothetical protein